MRGLVAVLLLCVTAFGLAAPVSITLPTKGDYIAYFEDDKGRELGRRAELKSVSGGLDRPDGNPKTLIIQDRKSGKEAVFTAFDKPVKVSAKDLVYGEGVKVNVERHGKAVASANVYLKDANGKRSELLSPDSKGSVTFKHVLLGKITVWADYTSEGEKRTSPEIQDTYESTGEQPTHTVSISLQGNVAVVGEEKAEGAEGAAPASPPGFGGLFTILTALVIGALALFGILKFVQKKEDWVRDRMGKMGVQLPTDPTTAPTTHTSGFRDEPVAPPPIVPPGTCPFCGGTEGACQCTLTSQTAVATASAFSPRLFGLAGAYAGAPFDVTGDVLTLGREPGNTICLEQDSSISRQHARLTRSGLDVNVEDLGSTNGTFVNGMKVETSTTLRPGDVVQFGESQFKYEA